MSKAWTAAIASALAAFAGVAAAQPGEVIPFPAQPPAAGSAEPLCAPLQLTRMVVRNISPGLQASAPAAQPRLLYRQGSTLLRSEESPDPTRGVHNIVVVAEPNIWSMNMVSATGQHQIDPGPDLNVHAPVLPLAAGLPPPFGVLEYGCEVEFVARHAPRPRQTLPWGADRANLHLLTAGDHVLSIIMHERRQAPLLIVYAREGKPVFAVRYDEWRSDLPDRGTLFAPPRGVRFTEAPARAAAQPPPNAPN